MTPQAFVLLRAFLILALLFSFTAGFSQTLGGRAAYSFLKLPPSPLLAAAGGVNVSYAAGEVSLTANNPALLQKDISKQINSSFNAFLAGTRAYSLTGALHSTKLATTFGGHIYTFDYGNIAGTDAAGNVVGQFRPLEYVIQVSAAKNYLDNWTYGLTLKFISSTLGQYRSSAVAADVGVLFQDTARGFSASVVVKNMGTQLTNYTTEKEELPFELQAGVTKRLARAPFAFSVTAQHLQTLDIVYNDTAFNRDNNISAATSVLDKLVTHLIVASHIYAGQNLEATIGYNLLRRRELATGNEGNGLTGFSAGLRLRLSKLQVTYARTAYQRGVAANLIGITVHLQQLFGLGR